MMATDGRIDVGTHVSGFSETYPEWRAFTRPWAIPPAIADAVLANRFNERADKRIHVRAGGEIVATDTDRFGALIGDNCRIGANAVLSPGTVLSRGSIVGRLERVAPAAP